MRFLRRTMAWLFFAGLLTAVGAGVFHFIRNRPRCTIEGPLIVRHLSPDGRWLVGLAVSDGKTAETPWAELNVYDAHSGQLIRSLPAPSRDGVQSPDGRHFVWQRRDGTLHVVEWESGVAWTPPMRQGGNKGVVFSPRGRWLWIEAERAEGRNVIVDLPARQLAPWPGDPAPYFAPDDRHALALIDPHTLHLVEIESGRIAASLETSFVMDRVGVRFSDNLRRMAIGNVRSAESRRSSSAVGWEECEPIEQFTFLNLEVWDLVEKRRVWEWKPAADVEFAGPALSPDGRRLAYWTRTSQGPRLEMVDLSTGAIQLVRAEARDRAFRRRLRFLDAPGDGQAASDVVLLTNDAGGRRLTIAGDGRVIWHEESGTRLFGARHDMILKIHGGGLSVIDVRNGTSRRVSPEDFAENPGQSAVLSADGKHVVMVGTFTSPPTRRGAIEVWLRAKWPRLFVDGQSGVIVAESAGGRERLRLLQKDPRVVNLSADGNTLAICSAILDKGIAADWDFSFVASRVDLWDISAHRAWWWGIVASSTIAGTLVLLRRWVGKRGAGSGPKTVR